MNTQHDNSFTLNLYIWHSPLTLYMFLISLHLSLPCNLSPSLIPCHYNSFLHPVFPIHIENQGSTKHASFPCLFYNQLCLPFLFNIFHRTLTLVNGTMYATATMYYLSEFPVLTQFLDFCRWITVKFHFTQWLSSKVRA